MNQNIIVAESFNEVELHIETVSSYEQALEEGIRILERELIRHRAQRKKG